MAWTVPAAGDIIRAQHIYQIINALNGVTGEAQAIILTKLSSTDFALDTKNLDTTLATGGRAFRAQDPSGNTVLRASSYATNQTITAGVVTTTSNIYGAFAKRLSIGQDVGQTNVLLRLVEADITGSPENSSTHVTQLIEHQSASQPTGGFDSVASGSNVIPDLSCISVVGRLMNTGSGAAQHADASMRTIEAHIFQYPNTGKTRDSEVFEVGIHMGHEVTSHQDNAGAYEAFHGVGAFLIHSDAGGGLASNPGFTNSVFRANYGIKLYGAGGFKHHIVCEDPSSNVIFDVDDSGNLTFRGLLVASGSAKKFNADFTNGTRSNRFAFQTSTGTSNTDVSIIPNNTTGTSLLTLYGQSNMDAADFGGLAMVGGTALKIYTDNSGAGSDRNIQFHAANGANAQLIVDTVGNVRMADAGIATSDTVGFFYINSCAGNPSGTPATVPAGAIPCTIDRTNGRFYAYYGSAWHYVALT